MSRKAAVCGGPSVYDIFLLQIPVGSGGVSILHFLQNETNVGVLKVCNTLLVYFYSLARYDVKMGRLI